MRVNAPLPRYLWLCLVFSTTVVASAPGAFADTSNGPSVYLRFRVEQPVAEKLFVTIGGWRHEEPWYFTDRVVAAKSDAWSEWSNLSDWPWHGKLNRSGGVAEWPTIRLSVKPDGATEPPRSCTFEVQLADAADEQKIVHRFTEKSEADAVAFLVPTPLREHADEFETGAQMAARHLAWATAAAGDKPPVLKDFQFITALWGHYDPGLARQELAALRKLGFNVVGNYNSAILKQEGFKTYTQTDLFGPDPLDTEKRWQTYRDTTLKANLATEAGRWGSAEATHWVLGDEVSALDPSGIEPARLNTYFRDYLKFKRMTPAEFGLPIEQAVYPAAAMTGPTMSRDAPLADRKLAYYGAKFRQYWSARQLRQSSDLIRERLNRKTELLPAGHGFFNAWGAPFTGMSYRLLDLFELGQQNAIDQLSAEDWLGLNHMYGPEYTWTGAQSLEYFAAVCRSATIDRNIELRALLTVSDDAYLRLKAFSAIGQGAKSFFFWTFGPTYIGTENYWSDLRSQYDGIAKIARTVEQAEPILMHAQPVRDPVAILYSVSHDLWYPDEPAAFVEKRLLGHALRHEQVQPDFVREDGLNAEALARYKVLYITDWCLTQQSAAVVDEWVRNGGVLYLSAGAATRDEFNEPATFAFAKAVHGAAGGVLTSDGASPPHRYNERTDLRTIKPMTQARVELDSKSVELPVLGYRHTLSDAGVKVIGRFADDRSAVVSADYGRGKVIGVGFLPMLAYGQLAKFVPNQLAEKWPAGPREIVRWPLKIAQIVPAADADVPVVETSLLQGSNGAVVVLANYTYEPVASLTMKVRLDQPITRAISTAGVPVKLRPIAGGVELSLPLEWTDMILLQP